MGDDDEDEDEDDDVSQNEIPLSSRTFAVRNTIPVVLLITY